MFFRWLILFQKILVHMKKLRNNFLMIAVFFMALIFSAEAFGQNEPVSSQAAKTKLIRGDVFILEKGTTELPSDFTKLKPITTIYVNEINVPNKAWVYGFPDLPEIYEWFAIEYSVTIKINQDGNYKFRIVSDDGAKLFIDNKKVVDNDGTHNFIAASGGLKLAKGSYNLKLQYFQGPRYEAGIQFFVKKDGSKEGIFPGDEIELLGDKAENSTGKQ
jgi:hypothetical protein